jgi:hypothetical protein
LIVLEASSGKKAASSEQTAPTAEIDEPGLARPLFHAIMSVTT